MLRRNTYTSAFLAVGILMTGSVMSLGQALPTQLSPEKVTAVDKAMQRIEKDGDEFEKEFRKALSSSTVKIEKRPELRIWVDRLEDTVDDLQKEYKNKDIKATHEKLVEALELAEGVNRFMLRAEFGSANQAWSRLREDLNTLAGAHSVPVVPVLIVTRVVTPSR